ncbi:MAG: hypothetical protein P4L46_20840 [Fimbriimonas sp.]|nr:hypothetical protein [Fimbriimonas sp.]
MSTTLASATYPRSSHDILRLNIETTIGSLLICFHVLFPLDLGMPGLSIGKTLSPSIVSSLVALLVIGWTSYGKVFACFRRHFAVGVLLFVAIMVAASSHAWNAANAFSHTIRFYCCFAVNYAIFVYLVEQYGYRWMTKAVLIGGGLAAMVAMSELLRGTRLGLYQHFIDASSGSGDPLDSRQLGFDFARATGTMGNPIFMSILMAVCIPFAFDLKSGVARFVMLALLAGGAMATVSRTAGLGIFVFFFGCAFVYRRKFWQTMAVSALLIGVVAVSSLGQKVGEDPYLLVWAARLGLVDIGLGTRSDTNVSLRANNSTKVFKDLDENTGPLEFLLGHGYLSSMLIARVDDGSPGTLDDTPVTLLYEEGIVGLMFFYGVFIVAAWDSRKRARETLHWYGGFALLASGFGTNFESYSMFNIVAIGSIAIATARHWGPADDGQKSIENASKAAGSE